MKFLLVAFIFALSAHGAFAATATCWFGEKELQLDVSGTRINSASWQNPDWGLYGQHNVDLKWVTFSGNKAELNGDTVIPEANGAYVCW